MQPSDFFAYLVQAGCCGAVGEGEGCRIWSCVSFAQRTASFCEHADQKHDDQEHEMAAQPDGRGGSLLSDVMIVLLIATLVMAVAAMVI
jgi:hypothetical protein